jgi:hypothetical protein
MKDSLLLGAMRNEGAFLLEWVAWYRMLGFENILIMHNDCTDHSPQLMRLLERSGVLAQKKHSPDADQPPQVSAYLKARSHPLMAQCDWMFHCDTDEFLVIHKGDGTINALIGDERRRFRGMAIHWAIFGNADQNDWHDEFVHRRFLRSAPEKTPQNNCFKSFVYKPLEFGKLRPHSPKFWKGEGEWYSGTNRWVYSNGKWFEEFDPTHNALNGSPNKRITHKDAQLNHYILQTREQFDFKKNRLCAAELKERYTDEFFDRFNHNSNENLSALKYQDAFNAAYQELIDIPGVLRLHHLCCADFVKEICEARGDDYESDPRYMHYKSTARTLPKHIKNPD